jgi:hypothetical protein
MGGVIDEDGTQWEHCNACGAWVDIMYLRFGTVTEEMADEIDARAKAWAEEERPLEDCDLCAGTGTRPGGLEEFGQQWFDWSNGCNGCMGQGKRPVGGNRGWHPIDRTAGLDLCDDCAERAGGAPVVGPAAVIRFDEDGSAETTLLQ